MNIRPNGYCTLKAFTESLVLTVCHTKLNVMLTNQKMKGLILHPRHKVSCHVTPFSVPRTDLAANTSGHPIQIVKARCQVMSERDPPSNASCHACCRKPTALLLLHYYA